MYVYVYTCVCIYIYIYNIVVSYLYRFTYRSGSTTCTRPTRPAGAPRRRSRRAGPPSTRARRAICLSIYPARSIHLSIYLSIHLYIYPSIYPSQVNKYSARNAHAMEQAGTLVTQEDQRLNTPNKLVNNTKQTKQYKHATINKTLTCKHTQTFKHKYKHT